MLQGILRYVSITDTFLALKYIQSLRVIVFINLSRIYSSNNTGVLATNIIFLIIAHGLKPFMRACAKQLRTHKTDMPRPCNQCLVPR